MKSFLFACGYVEPFRSYALSSDGGPREVDVNLRFFPRHVFSGGRKQFLNFQPWSDIKFVCKFGGDPLSNG